MGIATVIPSRDTITALPRYNKNQISNFVENDLAQALRLHSSNELIAKANSIVHLIDYKFHDEATTKQSLLDSHNFLMNNNRSNIPRISPIPSALIHRQIANNKIGFDFLTDVELTSFLTKIMTMIDKSYQVTDLSETLSIFNELIVGQSIYILRSCSNHLQHIPSGSPCLIVSTSFLRPLIEHNSAFIIYRLIQLPGIINGKQFIYSNTAEAIGINQADQTAILWEKFPKRNECLFSVFVYCQKKPPFIRLSSSLCLSELIRHDVPHVTSCQVTRSRKMYTDIINIDKDIWLFSNKEPFYCHLQTNEGDFNSIITITEPSIVRLPCGNTMKCSNIELTSSTCTNRNVLIKATAEGQYEQLTTIPWPIKYMTKQLVLNYERAAKDSLENILHTLHNDAFDAITFAKEFATIILSLLFLFLSSWILLFIRWIKLMVLKRIVNLESNVDDLVHVIVKK